MTSFKLDAIDCKIIRALRKNGRASFADIAKTLDIPAEIVKSRYNKMIRVGLIVGSCLVVDFSRLGLSYAALIGLEVNEQSVLTVKKCLDDLQTKRGNMDIFMTFGRYNIVVGLTVSKTDELFEIRDIIKQIDGMINVDISLTKDLSTEYSNLKIERYLEELCQ